ncbi:MAG TPA: hypothetical protein VEI02_15455 [Planctomycetota bacterium]|nr:hypothetical protein [Planctomycetota bacterium]
MTNTAQVAPSAYPAAVEPEGAFGPQVADYLTVVTRRTSVILVPFILVTLAATATAFLLPQEYKATTLMRVDDPEVVLGAVSKSMMPPHKPMLTTVKQDIVRVDFLKELIDKHGITEGYNPTDPKEYLLLVKYVLDHVEVSKQEQKVGPDLIAVAYSGRDARKVAEFVNAIRVKYEDEFGRRYQSAVRSAYLEVEKNYKAAETEFKAALAALKSFQQRGGGAWGSADEYVRGLREARAGAAAKFAEEEAKKLGEEELVADLRGKLADTARETTLTTQEAVNPVWAEQAKYVDQLQSELEKSEKVRTPHHPSIRRLSEELQNAKVKLGQMERFTVGATTSGPNPLYDQLESDIKKAEGNVTRYAASMARLKAELDDYDRQIEALPEFQTEYSERKSRRDNAEQRLATLTFQYNNFRTVFQRIENMASFFTTLEAPDPDSARDTAPVSPNIPMFIGIGAFVGLLVGAGLAFLKEFTAPAFTTPNQVRYTLAVPLLGELKPVQTRREEAARRRRRGTTFAVVIVLLAVLGYVHVAFFSKSMRGDLPRAVTDVMRKVYGK